MLVWPSAMEGAVLMTDKTTTEDQQRQRLMTITSDHDLRPTTTTKLQTEATFKTVLLNSSTSSEELVKQAIQRFRLPAGEDVTDYYLTVKRLEGSSAMLCPEEKPLIVFETLAGAALDQPKAKRSSVGNISSIASNLTQPTTTDHDQR